MLPDAVGASVDSPGAALEQRQVGEMLGMRDRNRDQPFVVGRQDTVAGYIIGVFGAGVFAGGDCIKSGEDLTVQSVEDGKRAAESINRALSA